MRRSWTWIINAFLLGFNAAAIVVLFASTSLADSPSSPSSPEDVFLQALFSSLGGMKGAGLLLIVAMITQLLVKFSDTKWAAFEGKWKLLAVSGLTLIGGVAALMSQGLTFMAALLHSTTLATAQVFLHQVVKQITEKPEPGKG